MAPETHFVEYSTSDTISPESLAPLLRSAVLGRTLYAFDACESTNAMARELIASDGLAPPNGTLVVADYQHAGRGRDGSMWQSPRAASLLMSLILYPAPARQAQPPTPATPHLVTMAASLALVRALRCVGAPDCTIKWPNDVLAPGGGKLAGLLTETVAGTRPALISGIGVNVNQSPESFPAALRERASSVRIVAGRIVSRLELLALFLEILEQTLALDDAKLFEAWQCNCSTLGQTVRMRHAERVVVGEAVGVDSSGSLRLRLPDGREHAVHSGEVSEVRRAS